MQTPFETRALSDHWYIMKPIYAHATGALALTFAIAACVPAPDSTPAPAPAPRPVATSAAPAPAPAPVYDAWIDAPQTAGDWRISGSQAIFADASSSGGPIPSGVAKLLLECRPGSIRVMVYSDSRVAVPVTIRTETAARSFTAQPVASGTSRHVMFDIAARDPILDAMALTRGRFAVEAQGTTPLYIPNWAEVTRVIEDCR